MKNYQTIANELKELQIQLPVSSMPEMEIPENYFEDFPPQLVSQIKSEVFLHSLPSNTPFQIPENYFLQFEGELNKKLTALPIEEISIQSPYSVSENYFAEFPDIILAKVSSSDFTSTNTKFSNKWFINFSMAATVLLFMGLAFMLLQKQQAPEHAIASLEKQLSTIPDYDIEYYAQSHSGELEQSLNLLPLDESMIDVNGLQIEILENSFNQLSDEDLSAYNL